MKLDRWMKSDELFSEHVRLRRLVLKDCKEMQKLSRLAQVPRSVSTKEELWTWTKEVEFCEVWSQPSNLFKLGQLAQVTRM